MQNSHDVGITIDTGKLPNWIVLSAMNVAYSEAHVRLKNALSLVEDVNVLPDFMFRMYVSDKATGELRAVVYAGSEGSVAPVPLSWSITISILAIIRLRDYTATYSEGNMITLYFGQVAEESRKSDMDRLTLLFMERPEFNMLALSNDLNQERGGSDEQWPEEEEA